MSASQPARNTSKRANVSSSASSSSSCTQLRPHLHFGRVGTGRGWGPREWQIPIGSRPVRAHFGAICLQRSRVFCRPSGHSKSKGPPPPLTQAQLPGNSELAGWLASCARQGDCRSSQPSPTTMRAKRMTTNANDWQGQRLDQATSCRAFVVAHRRRAPISSAVHERPKRLSIGAF